MFVSVRGILHLKDSRSLTPSSILQCETTQRATKDKEMPFVQCGLVLMRLDILITRKRPTLLGAYWVVCPVTVGGRLTVVVTAYPSGVMLRLMLEVGLRVKDSSAMILALVLSD